MIKKIRVEDLQVGMFVEDFNVPWMDHPFLTSRKLIRKAKEIQVLLDHNVRDVYIDTELGKDSSKAVAVTEADAVIRREMASTPARPDQGSEADPPARPAAEAATFEEELRVAKNIYGEAKALVRDMLSDARMGKSVDGERAARVVDDMVESIFRNQDALSSLSRLKNFDDYTFHHSVNVAVLSLTLGRHLGIVKGELRRLGVGAILHDVGKMMIPEAVLNKPGRLTEGEFAVMRTHTLHGAKILMKTREVPDDCSSVALNHHERFSGGGYPRGVKGLEIGKFGLISAIADVYDAVTSERVYQKGMPSYQAVQKLYEWAKTDFYPIYVQKFIQCLGIFPIGSVVRLDSGEIAVVHRQNHDQLLRPCVRLVRGANGEPADFTDVDLRDPDPAGDKAFRRSISAALHASEAGVDIEALLLGENAPVAA